VGEFFLLYDKESSVSLCLVTAVHKFDSRPVKNRTPSTGKPVESRPNGDLSSYRIYIGLYVFSAYFSRRQITSSHAVKAKALLLSDDQYITFLRFIPVLVVWFLDEHKAREYSE
jgi:hypothetical protein